MKGFTTKRPVLPTEEMADFGWDDFYSHCMPFIGPKGTMSAPVLVTIGESITAAPDIDGLVVLAPVIAPNGRPCLLNMFFPMPTGQADSLCSSGKLPVLPGSRVTIKSVCKDKPLRNPTTYKLFEVKTENNDWMLWENF